MTTIRGIKQPPIMPNGSFDSNEAWGWRLQNKAQAYPYKNVHGEWVMAEVGFHPHTSIPKQLLQHTPTMCQSQ